jgi:hypothetical protein
MIGLLLVGPIVAVQSRVSRAAGPASPAAGAVDPLALGRCSHLLSNDVCITLISIRSGIDSLFWLAAHYSLPRRLLDGSLVALSHEVLNRVIADPDMKVADGWSRTTPTNGHVSSVATAAQMLLRSRHVLHLHRTLRLRHACARL